MPPPAQPPLIRRLSRDLHLQRLVEELRTCRQALCDLEGSADPALAAERVRAGAAVQDAIARLELLGADAELLQTAQARDEEVPTLEAVIAELTRKTSFQHHEFLNPRAESCWLSTFFQSLWHSRAFHAGFERLIRPLPPGKEGTPLYALQATWERYERAEAEGHPAVGARGSRESGTVPVEALVQAWGCGYGDCAEAFGSLQGDPDLQALSDLVALVPVPFTDRVPTREELFGYADAMGVGQTPMLVLDMTLPSLPKASIYRLTRGLAPGPLEGPDLGAEHNLTSMICYLEEFAHYVVFCRRVQDPGRWVFFNDLPGLARGALRALEDWEAVTRECAHYGLCPRILMYESLPLAEQAAQKALAGQGRECRQM